MYCIARPRGDGGGVRCTSIFFDWDDEDFDRGNTRHVISAGYHPGDIEDAVLVGHRGPLGQIPRETGRPSLVAEIDGQDTYIVFEREMGRRPRGWSGPSPHSPWRS